MKGHDAIIAMRKEKKAPATVWVADFGDNKWSNYSDATPDVTIMPNERFIQLDLRWAVGLSLRMNFLGSARAQDAYKSFLEVKPKRIICSAYDHALFNGFPAFEIIQIFDTEGIMTWPT